MVCLSINFSIPAENRIGPLIFTIGISSFSYCIVFTTAPFALVSSFPDYFVQGFESDGRLLIQNADSDLKYKLPWPAGLG